ncbi:hypothetical protein [Acinetobacter indicus]|uniref:hypothetical protein n=1 Tax=Acinetobacter indicus TaxID=756892 RepID=UPI0014448F51|nr:hypothetical protein [Acinetobacter indicus]
MIMFVCDYVVREPFRSELRINLKKMSWDYISGLILEIYKNGGSFIIYKTETEYQEEYSTYSYHDIDTYSLISDKKYGYILGCSISNCKEYPEGTYLKLINKDVHELDNVYIFSPYDDEYNSKFVNQDIDIALRIFKEIFTNGCLTPELLTLFVDNSMT